MKRKTLIIFLACILLLVAAIFLPGMIWNSHLKALTKKPEFQIREVPESVYVTQPDEFAKLYASGKFIEQNSINNYRNNDFERIKEMVYLYLDHLEPEARDYYYKLMDIVGLEYSNSAPVSISTEYGPEFFTFAEGQLSLFLEDEMIYFYIAYEQKTLTILNFAINSVSYDPEWVSNEGAAIPYAKELANAAREYYGSLGISDNYYTIESGATFYASYMYD